MENFKYKVWEIRISFNSDASFFTCFKALYKKYRCFIKISGFEDCISLSSDLLKPYQIQEIKKIVSLLKRQPSSFIIKCRDISMQKDTII